MQSASVGGLSTDCQRVKLSIAKLHDPALVLAEELEPSLVVDSTAIPVKHDIRVQHGMHLQLQ